LAGRFGAWFRRGGAHRPASPRPLPRCGSCRYFLDDPAMLEREFRGLAVLGSAYGSARGGAGLCDRRGLFLSPGHRCPEFTAREGDGGEPSTADRR